MAEPLFNIFGDHLTRQTMKNVTRQPLSNIENMGKTVSSGPVKPNEPIKKSEGPKKSFLSNTGKALRNTPVRNVFTPRAVNVGSIIYNDETSVTGLCGEDVEFHKPSNKYDNYHQDLFDYLPVPQPEIIKQFSPPNTPPPITKGHSMEFNYSYQDEFFKDTWYSPIEKLMLWRNCWIKYDRNISNLCLRVHYDQLLITADTKILESFNMHHKLKGIYKDDVLILIASDSTHGIRKLKFQLKSDIAQCIEALSCHFPMVNHNGLRSSAVMESKYRNINDVLKCVVEQKENAEVSSKLSVLPKEFKNFVKLCVLDPAFPQIVFETERVLFDMHKNK